MLSEGPDENSLKIMYASPGLVGKKVGFPFKHPGGVCFSLTTCTFSLDPNRLAALLHSLSVRRTFDLQTSMLRSSHAQSVFAVQWSLHPFSTYP